MLSKKEMVAVLEVDDPEWASNNYQQCGKGTKWKEYLKMPENIKLSIRFVDSEHTTTQSTNHPTFASFNLYDFFRKYRKNCSECNPALAHVKELNKRLSELELKLRELKLQEPPIRRKRSRCCRSRRRTRSASCDPTEKPFDYTLGNEDSYHKPKLSCKAKRKVCEIASKDDTTWIYSNKRTQYSIPELSFKEVKCIDKSTSYIEWKTSSEHKPCYVRFDSSKNSPKNPQCETISTTTSTSTVDKNSPRPRTEERPSHMSTLFRRISAFFHSQKKVQLDDKDLQHKKLQERSSDKNLSIKQSCSCCKRGSSISNVCHKKKVCPKKSSCNSISFDQRKSICKRRSCCCQTCRNKKLVNKKSSKSCCKKKPCSKKSFNGNVSEMKETSASTSENMVIRKSSCKSVCKKVTSNKQLLTDEAHRKLKTSNSTQILSNKTESSNNSPCEDSWRELDNCKCCYSPSKVSLCTKIRNCSSAVIPRLTISKLGTSRQGLDSVSRTLERQNADIESLKQLVEQCLQKLDCNITCCNMNKKQLRKQKKLQKKEEKRKKREMKLMKKQEKCWLAMKKKKCKENKKAKQSPKSKKLMIRDALGDHFCKCCKCGETIECCKCSSSAIDIFISKKGHGTSKDCLCTSSLEWKSHRKEKCRIAG